MESLSLLELNSAVKESVAEAFPTPVWVRAEISEIHANANGHCYMELVEKSADSDTIVAKQKATIWSYTYRLLKPYFESTTGTSLSAGMQVLLSCQVEYHELYGVSLNVRDIDPTYTLGDMAARRAEIVRRLTEEGVIEMNKQLDMPLVPQRVAVISSASAAGYGDFCDQLNSNAYGYHFYTKLFPAVMQGAQTEQSVIAALDKVFEYVDLFDVVVIIRGGGATSDLAAFDNYNIAMNCAQFPLPIISGIGHQRDDSIVDLVAHTRVKTPTAAAEFLIDQVSEYAGFMSEYAQRFSVAAHTLLDDSERDLLRLKARLAASAQPTMQQQLALQTLTHRLQRGVQQRITVEERRLAQLEQKMEFNDVQKMLSRGYSVTLKDGKVLRSVADVSPHDVIETYVADGLLRSTVNEITKQ